MISFFYYFIESENIFVTIYVKQQHEHMYMYVVILLKIGDTEHQCNIDPMSLDHCPAGQLDPGLCSPCRKYMYFQYLTSYHDPSMKTDSIAFH